ncbi:MAG: hypothetical protein IPO34_17990, partial [Dehalococcoidia bacterium]|nr:hypothetical protein [Dehalococcoidia bacterium]
GRPAPGKVGNLVLGGFQLEQSLLLAPLELEPRADEVIQFVRSCTGNFRAWASLV